MRTTEKVNAILEEEIKDLIKKNTRNYAKRQITFFKRMRNHYYLSNSNITVDEVLDLL